jgi:hypothetical protein
MAMNTRTIWWRRAIIGLTALIVLQGIADRRPDKLPMLGLGVMIWVTVIGIGWLFANKRRR